MPNIKNNPYTEYKKEHIENSFFFDIKKNCNKNTKLPHMIPTKKQFIKNITDFNIHKNTKIIAYGRKDIIGAARVWWMFKYFGFNNISVLNGGLDKWKNENKPTTNKKSTVKKTSHNFEINKEWLIKKKDVLKGINKKNYIIIDARNSKRFIGKIRKTTGENPL
jgi:thiosulfate/3-mercaptopyruvate sulfurtransferase